MIISTLPTTLHQLLPIREGIEIKLGVEHWPEMGQISSVILLGITDTKGYKN